jgi:hypothetical protein
VLSTNRVDKQPRWHKAAGFKEINALFTAQRTRISDATTFGASASLIKGDLEGA